ncbi:MAG: HNH endonuclease [Candidatus Sericytochromatia bacterium]
MFEKFEKYTLRINNSNYSFINSLDFSEYYKEIYNYIYDPLDYKTQKKTILGSKKVCSFCGESNPKNLTDEIHVIPASFGNRWLFSIEECNECNKKFGRNFEQNLAEMFAANRIFSSIPKRKGFSKIQVPKTKSYIQPEEEGKIKLQTYEDENEFKIEYSSNNSAVITIPAAPYYPIKAIKSLIHSLWLVIAQEKRKKYIKILDWLDEKIEILPFYYTVGFTPGPGLPSVGFTVWEKIKDNNSLTNLIIKFWGPLKTRG